MQWIYLIHEFHNLSWITEINELFHDILIYWDAPVFKCFPHPKLECLYCFVVFFGKKVFYVFFFFLSIHIEMCYSFSFIKCTSNIAQKNCLAKLLKKCCPVNTSAYNSNLWTHHSWTLPRFSPGLRNIQIIWREYRFIQLLLFMYTYRGP